MISQSNCEPKWNGDAVRDQRRMAGDDVIRTAPDDDDEAKRAALLSRNMRFDEIPPPDVAYTHTDG